MLWQLFQGLIVDLLNILSHFCKIEIMVQEPADSHFGQRYLEFLQMLNTVADLEIIYGQECWTSDQLFVGARLRCTLMRLLEVFDHIGYYDFDALADELVRQNWVQLLRAFHAHYQDIFKRIQLYQKTNVKEYFLISVSIDRI